MSHCAFSLMGMRRSVFCAVLLVTVLAPCAPAQSRSASAKPSSNPVRISQIDASAWIDEARATVGSVSTDGQVVSLGAGATGRLRTWSVPDGHVTAIGRAGAGPGELRSLGVTGWQNHQLAAFDPALRRITVFSRTGELVSTTATGSIAPVSFGADGGPGLSVPFTGMGESVLKSADSTDIGTFRDGMFVLSFQLPRRSGMTLDVPTPGGGVLRTQHPAGAQRDWVFSPDGAEACGTELSGSVKDRSLEFTVDCRSAAKPSDRWVQRVRLPAVMMTRAWADSAATAFVAETKLPAQVRINMSNELVKRDFISPVDHLISAGAGRILIQLRSHGASVEVFRLNRSGAQATATFPPDTRLVAARGPWIVTARDGDDGAVQIVLWRWDG